MTSRSISSDGDRRSHPSETAAETKKMVFSAADGRVDDGQQHKIVSNGLEIRVKEEPESHDEAEENTYAVDRSTSSICGLISCKAEVGESLNNTVGTRCYETVQLRRPQFLQEVMPKSQASELQESFNSEAEDVAIRESLNVSPNRTITEATKTLRNAAERNLHEQCRSTLDHALVEVKEERDAFEGVKERTLSVEQSELPAYHLVSCKLEFGRDSRGLAFANEASYDGFTECDVEQVKTEVLSVTQTLQETLSEEAESAAYRKIQDLSSGATSNCESTSRDMSDKQLAMLSYNGMPSSGERFMEPRTNNMPNTFLCISEKHNTSEKTVTSTRNGRVPDAELVDAKFTLQSVSRNASNNDAVDILRQTAGMTKDCYVALQRLNKWDLKRHRVVPKCHHCNLTYTTLQSLNLHKIVHAGETGFACVDCDETIASMYTLKIYNMLRPGGSKPFQCIQCDKRFTLFYHLRTHIREHEKEVLFACSRCSNKFNFVSWLRAHKRIRVAERHFACSRCSNTFSCLGGLMYHEHVHAGTRLFACSQCDKSFTTKFSLIAHRRVHTGDLFTCPLCDKKFIYRSYLRLHEKIHTGEKPFACTLCDKRFLRNMDLMRHQVVHTREKSFVCPQCGKRFAFYEQFKRHEKIHTREKPFACAHCGKGFYRNVHLRRHQVVHTGEKPFGCSQCGKRYARLDKLKFHEKAHSGTKPFTCSHCGKGFRQNAHLKKHQAVHTREKLFVCSQCGEAFAHYSHLKKHKRIHAGEKSFACTRCSKRFSRRAQLMAHEIVHTGVKHFVCSKCDKRFSYHRSLKNHESVHSGKKPFACARCDKTFVFKHGLTTHERVHKLGKPEACFGAT